ncbi:MAG: hypothetical protein D3924_17595, partial [Candidatus Electrothrix sp. AR4]|nr:hypothetical protein [Candidatus Electrothrix sp. AR4]
TFDYGDLPSSYATLKEDNGARHRDTGANDLYLGVTPPDTESDGTPDIVALGDGADEDGIIADSSTWIEGLVADGVGGSVQVNVTGSGWLVAWVDFDGDGSFSTLGEMIISEAVTSDTQPYTFDIPAGTFDVSLGYARFRLFPEKPAIPEFAYQGTADNGEVEDVRFDFGTGTIGDRVWLDENGDGVQDVGEAGISGVTVYIDDDGTPGYSADDTQAVTDSNGDYLLKDLTPGIHTVLVKPDTLPPGGLEPIFDEDSGTIAPDGTISVPLSTGDSHLTADFGYNWVSKDDTDNPVAAATGAIGDRIWNDADGDGVQDPAEIGIADVTVRLLTDDNNDGVYGGVGDNPVLITTTEPDGRYIFDGLAPGGYIVEVSNASLDAAGYNIVPTGDPDSAADSRTTSPIVLGPGDVFVNADFGYNTDDDGNPNTVDVNSGHAIGDIVYLDSNANGVFDAGIDQGIAGVSVILEDGDGNILATATTDANGTYLFDGLLNNSYTVKVLDNANLLDGLISTADPDGGADSKSALTLSGADDLDQDFGYALQGHSAGEGLIGDTIFLDTGDG